MKYTITLFFAMIGMLVMAQSQIIINASGQPVKVYVDGNLQSQFANTYFTILNVPQGHHEVRIESQGYGQMMSAQSLFFTNYKKYNFDVANFNGMKQLVLSSMTNTTMMHPNGSNIVNYSSHMVNQNYPQNNGNGGSVTIITNSGGITTHVQDNTGQMSGVNSGVHPQMNSYNGNVGCYKPRISRSDFLSAIRRESFDDDKLRVAKLAMKHNAISVDDLIAGMNEFSFDDRKLDLAKYGYDHIIDLNNAYKIGNSFTFSSSKDKWHNYVESK